MTLYFCFVSLLRHFESREARGNLFFADPLRYARPPTLEGQIRNANCPSVLPIPQTPFL